MIAGLSLPPELELTDEELALFLEEVLNLQAAANVYYFRAHPEAPCCLGCGKIKYQLPRLAERQTFASAHEVCTLRKVGCAGAAAYEAGMALHKGKDARVVVELVSPGEYHALVEYGDGTRSDPSAKLPRT